jgi:hypothetical protein
MTSACLTRQLDRWTRPNAHLFVRPDWRRFAPRADAEHPFARYEQKYRPDQPRVPAGNSDGGQWTADGAGDGSRSSGSQPTTKPPPINDPRVISDATPDNNWKPGARYAQGPRARAPLIINGSRVEPTPGQATRLAIVEAQSRDAIRRVQELDPRWRPTPEIYSSVEGLIASHQALARQAEGRILELGRTGIGPGPYVGESIPARGPARDFTVAERLEINRVGRQTGCHTCGTKNPGPSRDSFVPDHQPPTALSRPGQSQRLYPHCISCSLKQGGYVRWKVGD